METNETNNPPILVTSDVKFAVMKDGTVVMDDEVKEGPGWLDVANAFVEIVKKADEHQILAISMAKAFIVNPEMKFKADCMLKELQEKKAAEGM